MQVSGFVRSAKPRSAIAASCELLAARRLYTDILNDKSKEETANAHRVTVVSDNVSRERMSRAMVHRILL